MTKSFTVYRSSAGSGKTFTLVKEYLKIILEEPGSFRHILAITFTNKAAAEMKERVLHSLRQLSLFPESPDRKIITTLLPQLVRETGLSSSEITSNAAKALKLILHNYTDFSIGTIDSFSHRIIRSFAHDFGLPVQFNVEVETSDLLTTAVDLLLDKVGEDENLTRFLVRFLEVRMDDEQGWSIDKILVNFGKALLDEEGQNHIQALKLLTLPDFSNIFNQIQKKINSFEKALRQTGSEAMTLIIHAGLNAECFFQGNKGIFKYFEYLSLGRFEKLVPNAFVSKTMDEDKWESGKIKPDEKKSIRIIKPDLIRLFGEISQLLDLEMESYELHKLIAKTLFPLAVLNEIDKTLTAFKKQHNLIHISEFNTRISAVVMNEPVPFIYERLGERYQHLMIDEFQDTSKLQWQNFIPLMENALSGGYFNLVVGDGKQAIYRWRNGDVTQFTQLPFLEGSNSNQLIRERQKVFEQHFNEQSLIKNFRSRVEIVDFNNGLFRYIVNQFGPSLSEVYRGLEQEADPDNKGGLINIRFFNRDSAGLSSEEWNINEIQEILQSLLKDGYTLKDIAVLCRKNEQASKLARELILSGINVISSESLLLTQSPEVNFLVSALRFLFEEDNVIIQAEMAGFLLHTRRLGNLDWHEMLRIITENSRNGEGLIQLLKTRGIEFDKNELLALPVYDLCESLIRIFSLNQEANPYLLFFLDAVLAFSTREVRGISDFLEWWDDKGGKLSVLIPEGVDAVSVMTIHKSKGLQFPVVIFPFANERMRMTRNYLWTDIQEEGLSGLKTVLLKVESALEKTVYKDLYLEEERKSLLDLVNLLYVVMTRPEERLYILTNFPQGKKENNSSLPDFFAGFLKSIDLWSDNISNYTIGEHKMHEVVFREHSGEQLRLEQFISEDWRKKIRIRCRAPQLWNMEDPGGKMDFGNQVHTLLAGIITGADLEPVLQQGISGGLIALEDLDRIRQMLASVIHHPELEILYSDQVTVKTEAEILLPDGRVFRPDRVVFQHGQPVVVEYKTGRKDPGHATQLMLYENLLKSMGYLSVKKYLVYLSDKAEVMEIM